MREALRSVARLCLVLSPALGFAAPPGAATVPARLLPRALRPPPPVPLAARRRRAAAAAGDDDANAWRLEAISTEIRELKRQVGAAELTMDEIARTLERVEDSNREIEASLRRLEGAVEGRERARAAADSLSREETRWLAVWALAGTCFFVYVAGMAEAVRMMDNQ
jgi:septal ring factor EnvC (AmiA/AmiB activator)